MILPRARLRRLTWRLERDRGAEPVETRYWPLVVGPGLIPGSWIALVALGALVGFLVQLLMIRASGADSSALVLVDLIAVASGIVGAKLWFLAGASGRAVSHGWSVQGLVAAVVLIAPLILRLRGAPVGAFLDASAPGLFVAMAIGRIGCFFTGCCSGRPTTSRFGVWSSNNHLGIRRIPTQLTESALALTTSLATLVSVVARGADHGAIFAAGLAGYTALRQPVLAGREQARRSRNASLAIALIATATWIAAVGYLVAR